MGGTPNAEAATRFLILSDEGEVEDCQRLVESRYHVASLYKAKTNGIRRSIDGKPVLCWPSSSVQAMEAMREFALELTDWCPEVKFLDASLPLADLMRPKDFPDFKALLLWATGELDGTNKIQVIPRPDAVVLSISQVAPAVNLEQREKQASNRTADSDQQDGTEYAVDPRTVNRDSPDGHLPPDPVSQDMDADQAAPGESRPIEDWQADPDENLTAAYGSSERPESDDQPPSTNISYRPADRVPAGDTWPEPLDLSQTLYRGKPLPLNLVPAPLKPLLSDFQKRTGIDAAALFCGLLGAISGLANDFIRIQPKQKDYKWTVRGVIWPFCIGDSSSGKTTGLEEGMQWVQRRDQLAVVDNVRRLKNHEHEMNIYADSCAIARKNKQPRPEEPPEPVLREYWVSRGTTEGVTRLLQHSPKVVWYMDEASGLINGWDRYAAAGKGSGDREFVLMLWNGGPGKNTLAGKTVSLPNASAVLCGGSTPIAMLKCAGGKIQSDGFLQRTFLAMVPPMRRGTDAEPDEDAYAAYDRILDGLLDMHGTALVHLSPDASLIYNEFMDKLASQIALEESESMKFHLAKWNGMAPRLMLLYFMVERAQYGQHIVDGAQIPAEISHQVCSLLMEWQLSHLQQFWYELMADKVGRKFSQTIARYVLANPQLTEIKFRDHVARPHWRELEALKPWEIKESINALINGAWLTPQGQKINSYGVSPIYSVNPRIALMFSEQRDQEIQMRSAKREELALKRGGQSHE